MYQNKPKQLGRIELPYTKIWLIMRLTTVILLASLMQVSASTFGQKININQTNVPLTSIFKEIRKQSGYDFYYNSKDIPKGQKVNIAIADTNLEDALNIALKGTSLVFEIDEKIITIKKKPDPSLLEKIERYFSNMDVYGKVSDENGSPLAGASIKVKGTNITALSDWEGRFFLKNVDENAILVISYVGYGSKEVKASPNVNVALAVVAGELEAVTINKGYYSTSKELNTGSVSSVKAEDIAKQPISDPLLALQGKIPGLYLYETSGIPGAGLVVRLRGQNSIANGNSPFYIVDGVPFSSTNLSQNTNATGSNLSPFTSIRPEDIASIEVLKDADATAIYGSRGANGVILITTKRGKSGQTKIDVNLSNGLGEVAKRMELMNTEQYLEMRKEAYKNDGFAIPTSSSPIVYLSNTDLTLYDQNKYTDWQKELLGGTAHYTNAQVSISGGNAQTQFLLSGSYRKETTVFPGKYSNQIGSVLSNINHTSENGKFRIDFSANYSSTNNRLPIIDFTTYIFNAPNAPDPYNDNGTLNWLAGNYDNPYANAEQKLSAKTDNLNSNLTLSYNILKDLQFKSNVGYNKRQLNELSIYPGTRINPRSATGANDRINDTGINGVNAWIIDPQLNYKHAFGKHTIEALAGASWQQSIMNGIQTRYTGFSSDDLIENPSAATTVSRVISSNSKYHYNAVYGRIGYNYNEKYVVNLTGRRDGSSRFGSGKQFGNFGAIGVAWIFSKEAFLKLPSFVSFGKLRASIGKTGNDQLLDYEYLSTYLSSGSSYLGLSTLEPKSLTNPFYGWETINKIEAGLETGFFKDRLFLNVNWYRNRTSNQLVGYNLPVTTGFSSIRANLPAVIENKGWELELSSSNVKGKSFTWATAFNVSIPKNKLISYPNIESSSYATRFVVGQPLFLRFLYKFNGLNPTTGVYTFEDLNKDGVITSAGDRVPVFVGQKWFGSISNSFTFKGISIDFSFQFVKQTGFDLAIEKGTPGRFNTNEPVSLLNRWQKIGDQSVFQKYSSATSSAASSMNSLFMLSDALITDASFVRLKNVSLSWQLPAKWQRQLKTNTIRFYLQGQNLLTITKYKGLDPETNGTISTLPSLRVVTAGLNLTF